MAKEKTKSRFMRLPQSLDEWLVTYASRNDFGSQQDLIRHILREFKKAHEHDEHGVTDTRPLRQVASGRR